MGFPSKKIGTVFNVPIYVELPAILTVVLLAIWVYSHRLIAVLDYKEATTALLSIGLLIWLLFHEFAHVRAGQLLGFETKEVRLILFGAVACMQSVGNSALTMFLIAIAGPIMSVILWAIFYISANIFADTLSPFWLAAFTIFAEFNIIIAIFNMLPMFPMDGGRCVVSAFWAITKNFTLSLKIGAVIAIIFAVLLGVLSVYINAYVMLMVMVFIILSNLAILRSPNERILQMHGI
ncbi:MAG: hypothetical protein HC836_25705 [Richelia sp. RM2_1_2]|nr:hypothetical protein [Richelia sp. RM2_1_2]